MQHKYHSPKKNCGLVQDLFETNWRTNTYSNRAIYFAFVFFRRVKKGKKIPTINPVESDRWLGTCKEWWRLCRVGNLPVAQYGHGKILSFLGQIYLDAIRDLSTVMDLFQKHTIISVNIIYILQNLKWVFPKIGVSQNGWFIMENPIQNRGIPKWMVYNGKPY